MASKWILFPLRPFPAWPNPPHHRGFLNGTDDGFLYLEGHHFHGAVLRRSISSSSCSISASKDLLAGLGARYAVLFAARPTSSVATLGKNTDVLNKHVQNYYN